MFHSPEEFGICYKLRIADLPQAAKEHFSVLPFQVKRLLDLKANATAEVQGAAYFRVMFRSRPIVKCA
jgi:hypothetical protein